MTTPLTDEQINQLAVQNLGEQAAHTLTGLHRFARALLAQPEAAQHAPGGDVLDERLEQWLKKYEKTVANEWLGRFDIARLAWKAALQSTQAQGQDAAPAEQPPFGTKRAAALALYKPPFKFRMGYIHDAGGHMVADQDGFGEGSKVFDTIAARVRGWGRIGYMPDPEALQDEVGAVIADALTAYWSASQAGAQEQAK